MINCRRNVETLTPYIPGRPIDDVKKEYGLTDVIKLASNENPYGCSPKAKEAIIQSLSNISIYPDGNTSKLRAQLSNKFNVEKDSLIFGAGSDELIGILAQTYIEDGDEAITCIPTFPRYYSATKLMGGKLIGLPLNDKYAFDLDAIYNAINSKTKLIYICNPNNPTGTIVTASELNVFLDKVPSDILVVLDEAYSEFIRDNEYPDSIPLLSKYKNIIILKTFSKAYGLASLRIGYGIADKDIIEKMNRVRGPFNITIPAYEAAIAAINDEEFLDMVFEANKKVKEYSYSKCDELGLEYIPAYGNFFVLKVDTDTKDIFKKLLAKGIIIRPGHLLGMEGWLRVTFGTEEQMSRFFKELSGLLSNTK